MLPHGALRTALCAVAVVCQSKAAAIIIDYKLFDYTNSAKLGSLFRRESTSHTLKRRELKCTFT